MKKIVLFLFLGLQLSFGQEIFSTVKIDYSQVEGSNVHIFKTLQTELEKWINTQKWTDVEYEVYERLQVSFVITVIERQNNNFNATLQVLSRRPVFKSLYYSPILSINDKNFNFEYVEYQPLLFNENIFQSNLTQTIAFYIYTALGADADTFKLKGGTPYFKIAQTIVDQSQGKNYPGWSSVEGSRSRFTLIDDWLAPAMGEFRVAIYAYHRRGLDVMNKDIKLGKQKIANTIINMGNSPTRVINSYPVQLFFNTKKDEIYQIFRSGPITTFNLVKLKQALNIFTPNQANLWRKIKN